MGRSWSGQVQILKLIANDFIRDTDYSENKAIACKARTLSVSSRFAAKRISVRKDAINMTVHCTQ